MARTLILSLSMLLALALPCGAQPDSSEPIKEYRGFLIDMECDPLRNAQKLGEQPGQGTPPPGCGAGSNTTHYGLYGNGKILRFDDASNRVFRIDTETNASLKNALVSNSAGRPRLRVAATAQLNGDVLTIKKIRRLNRLAEQPGSRKQP